MLCLLFASTAQAQFISSGNGAAFGNASAGSPTATPTWNPLDPTYTPTPTPTYNPFATDTATPTPGSPTDTITDTFTATQTGTIFTSTPTWTSTPGISRSSLVLFPTAYTNGLYDWTGFNWDIDFTYFIGSILSRDDTNPQVGLDSLEQINIILLTNDLKYAWLADDGEQPGIASGLLTSLLAQVGSGSSDSTASSTQTFQVAGNAVGGLYTVMSKTVAKDTAVHFGYIYGLEGLGVTSLNYSALLPYFGPGLYSMYTDPNNPMNSNTDSLFYVGFNTRFWGRNWKMEIWKPFPMNQNPILLNTQIDGLPLAFNLGYERWDNGFALLGYVNFRIPLLPSSSPY